MRTTMTSKGRINIKSWTARKKMTKTKAMAAKIKTRNFIPAPVSRANLFCLKSSFISLLSSSLKLFSDISPEKRQEYKKAS